MEFTVPKIEEYEEVNKLAIQVHNCHVGWRPDLFHECNDIITKEDLEEMINKNSIFVAKEDGKIVGYVSIVVKVREHKGFRYRKQLDIDSICIDENYRNKGIGTALLNYVKEYAIQNDCTDISLNVFPQNVDAIHVYEKMGMQVKSIGYSMQIKEV